MLDVSLTDVQRSRRPRTACDEPHWNCFDWWWRSLAEWQISINIWWDFTKVALIKLSRRGPCVFTTVDHPPHRPYLTPCDGCLPTADGKYRRISVLVGWWNNDVSADVVPWTRRAILWRGSHKTDYIILKFLHHRRDRVGLRTVTEYLLSRHTVLFHWNIHPWYGVGEVGRVTFQCTFTDSSHFQQWPVGLIFFLF
jgi:hypothetical protein